MLKAILAAIAGVMNSVFGVLAILACVALPTFAAPSYTAVILTPPTYTNGQAYGIFDGQQGGYATSGAAADAILWSGTSASGVSLTPAGFVNTKIWGMAAGQQVGSGITTSGPTHALLWAGSASSFVDLHPAGYSDSQAFATSGNQQAGYADTALGQFHAMVWSGSAVSAVDLNPAGMTESFAKGVAANQQVGWGRTTSGSLSHALLWTGSSASVVDLTPTASQSMDCAAWAIDGIHQVGNIGTDAVMWSGTEASVVNLQPAGYGNSSIRAIAGNFQAGMAELGHDHAMLWQGTAGSALDLHQFLPLDAVGSYAYGVDSAGNVVGTAVFPGAREEAVMWIVPEPSCCALFIFCSVVSAIRRRR